MKQFIMTLIALAPLAMWAQDNTWEKPEVEEQEAKQTVAQVNPNQKYLRGAVPLVNGQVVFTKHIEAPGKSASQIYDILHGYMQKMTKEKNQLEGTKLLLEDAAAHQVSGWYEEWLVFKANAISLDRTRFYFALTAKCQDGSADITMSRIRYFYEEERSPQRLTAEEWIVDKEAVNKKFTKLLPITGKFRRKTIDRKDFLFNKFESLLK